jgi:hypothetical protein
LLSALWLAHPEYPRSVAVLRHHSRRLKSRAEIGKEPREPNPTREMAGTMFRKSSKQQLEPTYGGVLGARAFKAENSERELSCYGVEE